LNKFIFGKGELLFKKEPALLGFSGGQLPKKFAKLLNMRVS
jgi:hypothetical protein